MRASIGIIHVHSNYSHDGLDPLERVRDFAAERGISFVGLTEHAEDFDPSRYEEYREHCQALSDSSVRLIAGLEFRFAGYPGLHLLALGLARMLEPRTPEQFCHQAAAEAQFTVLAHPVLARYEIPDVVSESIDAIEVWNASYNTRFLPDVRAIRLFQSLLKHRPQMVATAGLDQHDCRNDRETRVVLSDSSATSPLGELKAGRFINRGKTMTFDSRVSYGSARLAALSAARWSLERANDVHDRALRLIRSRKRGRR